MEVSEALQARQAEVVVWKVVARVVAHNRASAVARLAMETARLAVAAAKLAAEESTISLMLRRVAGVMPAASAACMMMNSGACAGGTFLGGRVDEFSAVMA